MPHTPKLVPDRGREDIGPYMLKEAEEQVQLIHEQLKTAQSRQKSYADTKRRPLTFAIGDLAYLRVSPEENASVPYEGKISPDILAKLKSQPVEEKLPTN